MAPYSTPHAPSPVVPRAPLAPATYGPGAYVGAGPGIGGARGAGATPATGAARGPHAAGAPHAPNATIPRPGSVGGPHAPATLDALLDSLRSERKLLEDLVATMRRQRGAVAADDLQTVDDTVFATHRILATLGQARLRRKQISRLLAGVDEFPMRDLEEVVGPQIDDRLRAARDELQTSAQALAREVDVNRRVLRDALAHGEAHARVLAGAADPSPGTSVPGGVLLDRTA